MELVFILVFLCLGSTHCGASDTAKNHDVRTRDVRAHDVHVRDADTPLIIISEVNAANPSSDNDQEFIELYNTENRAILLQGYVIVLYDGSVLQRAYDVIDLSQHAIQPHGYFVIGSSNVTPRPNLVLEKGRDILQNGPDAVALYYGTPSAYTKRMPPTKENLMDVVVYTKHANINNSPLTSALVPGQLEVLESGIVDVSVSRCGGMTPLTLSLFRSTYPSPGGANDCRSPPKPNIVINEVNADNPSYRDAKEFIELYNPGDEDISLDAVYLVLYDGDKDWASQVVDLTGRQITAKGYFVVGSGELVPRPDYVIDRENILGNREDGVALYYSPDSRIYELMEVTADSLLDAVVYSVGSWDGTNTILQTLTPGQQALHEDSDTNPGEVDESLSRCKGLASRSMSQFVVSYPTPGSRNNCSVNAPKVVINEFSANNPSSAKEFVELYNPGTSVVTLDSVYIVFYNGENNLAYLAIDLSGYTIRPNDYFIIAPDNPTLIPDHKLDKYDDAILGGEGGIGLYYDPGGSYFVGMPLTFNYLIDGIVYSPKNWAGSDKVQEALAPGNDPLYDDVAVDPRDIVLSLGRCGGNEPINFGQWNRKLVKASPRKPNMCENYIPNKPGVPASQASATQGKSSGGTVAAIVIVVGVAVAVASIGGFILYRRRRMGPSRGDDVFSLAYNAVKNKDRKPQEEGLEL
ncbi:Hypp7365 [Branchiostoma lanceolatum]|uniref:Hypp7365 protein n=1 Tax=Branchiostoma lanceolatum TaxID=7740 RepID=A0A8J9YZF3_BRALA|nr:Hypp7365 [Branchiostoma lanceolatum]